MLVLRCCFGPSSPLRRWTSSLITDELSGLPYAQRVAAVRAYQRLLDEPEATKLNYAWPLHARDSQLPPPGDWDTWMILAGRGFGKTRTGAEWVRAQVENKQAHRIALVARTLDEAQSVMIEGESGILNISPLWDKPTYEPSKRKLTWPNGAFALAFSSHEPDQLSPNPPKDTDGRREDSGRGVRELPGRWPGLHWGRWEVGGRSSVAAQGPYGRLRELRCAGWRENTQQGTLADWGGASLRGRWVSCRLAVRPGVEWLAAGPRRE